MDVIPAIPLPTIVKTEPVDIIDLDDDKSPEEVVNEWHEKIRKKLNQHLTPKNETEFTDMLKWYLDELQIVAKDMEDLTNLEYVLLHQIRIIEMSYSRLKMCQTTDDSSYLHLMEDILTCYWDIVMKNITKMKKEISKSAYRKVKAQICRRLKCILLRSLLENQQTIFHVLIKSRLEPEEATHKEIVNHCYSYFLTRVKQERSEINYCLCYIVIERWKTIRKPQEHEMLDKCLYTMFSLDSDKDKLEFEKSIENILKATSSNIRGMIRNYFAYVRTSTICHDLDEIILDSPTNLDISSGSDLEWDEDHDETSPSASYDSWKAEFEKASQILESKIITVKQENSDDDNDCLFVSSSLGNSTVGKTIMVREVCVDEHIAEISYPVKDTGQTLNNSGFRKSRFGSNNTEKHVNFNSRITHSQPTTTTRIAGLKNNSNPSRTKSPSNNIKNNLNISNNVVECAISPIPMEICESSDVPPVVGQISSNEQSQTLNDENVADTSKKRDKGEAPIQNSSASSQNKDTEESRPIPDSTRETITEKVPSRETATDNHKENDISHKKTPISEAKMDNIVNLDIAKNKKIHEPNQSEENLEDSGTQLETSMETDDLSSNKGKIPEIIDDKDASSPATNTEPTKPTVEENNKADSAELVDNGHAKARVDKIISQLEKMKDAPEDALVLVIDKKHDPELVVEVLEAIKRKKEKLDQNGKANIEENNSKKDDGDHNSGLVGENTFASMPTPPADQTDYHGNDGNSDPNKKITVSHYFSSFPLSQEDIEMDSQPTYQYATITEEPPATYEQVIVSEVVPNEIIEGGVTNCKVIFDEANYIATTSESYLGTYDILMQGTQENSVTSQNFHPDGPYSATTTVNSTTETTAHSSSLNNDSELSKSDTANASVAQTTSDTCLKLDKQARQEETSKKIAFTSRERVSRSNSVCEWADDGDTQDLVNIFSGPVNTQLKQNTIENPDENFDLFESNTDSCEKSLPSLIQNENSPKNTSSGDLSSMDDDNLPKIPENNVSVQNEDDRTESTKEKELLSQKLIGKESMETMKEDNPAKSLPVEENTVSYVNGDSKEDPYENDRPSSPEIDSPPYKVLTPADVLGFTTRKPHGMTKSESIKPRVKKVQFNIAKNEKYDIPDPRITKAIIDGEEVKINSRSLYTLNFPPDDPRLLSGLHSWKLGDDFFVSQKTIDMWENLTKQAQRKKLIQQRDNCKLKNDENITSQVSVTATNKPIPKYRHPSSFDVEVNKVKKSSLLLSNEPGSYLKSKHHLQADHSRDRHNKKIRPNEADINGYSSKNNALNFASKLNGTSRTTSFQLEKKITPPNTSHERKGILKKTSTYRDHKVGFEDDNHVPRKPNHVFEARKSVHIEEILNNTTKDSVNVKLLENNNGELKSRTLRNRKRPNRDYDDVTRGRYLKLAKTKF